MAPSKILSAHAGGGLGDRICQLSALRAFARLNPGTMVYFDAEKSIIDAFGDDLVWHCEGGTLRMDSFFELCLPLMSSNPVHHNLVGVFLSGLGAKLDSPPSVELPEFPNPGVTKPYAVIQPWSRFVPNPPVEFIQDVVDDVVGNGLRVFAVGRPSHDERIKGVDYSMLDEDVGVMLGLVRHASVALTPNSATAHVAAAYGVPSTLWLPRVGQNWLVNYPGWERTTIHFK